MPDDASKDIHDIICRWSLEDLQTLYDEGVSVNEKNIHGRTPLQTALALQTYREDIVKSLIIHGADVNVTDDTGQSPLHVAVERGYYKVIGCILEHGANINAQDCRGLTPLHLALLYDNRLVVNLLINKAADVTIKPQNRSLRTNLLLKAINHSCWDVAQAMLNVEIISIKDDQDQSLLHLVAKHGPLHLVKAIIERGADINAKDNYLRTPLMHAISKYNFHVALLLIRSEADVTAEDNVGCTPLHYLCSHTDTRKSSFYCRYYNVEMSEQDKNGGTVIHNGEIFWDMKIAESLINHGANIHARDRCSRTPLFTAADNGYLQAVQLLLKCGADISVKDEQGNTPLHVAAFHHDVDVSRCIIDAGADINATNNKLLTPLSLVIYYCDCDSCYDIFLFLIEKGADADCVVQFDHETFSLVDFVTERGRDNLLTALLERGAVFDCYNKYFNTPFNFAARFNKCINTKCLKVLLDWGASFESYNETEILNYMPLKLEMEKKCSAIFCHIKDHADKLLCIDIVKRNEVDQKECYTFQDFCLKELAQMRQIKYGIHSLFDLLLPDCNPQVATNTELERELINGEKCFPIYHSMLRVALIKAKLRWKLLNEVEQCFNVNFLPARIKLKILSYLSNRDLKNILRNEI